MDDQGGSRGRHAADSDGPDDADRGAQESGAHRSPGTDPTGDAPTGPTEPTGPTGRADDDTPTGPGPVVDLTDEAEPASTGRRRGRMRQQDPSTTSPRPPSVAERRARRAAQRRERAQAEAAEAARERKRTTRKRVLVGGGVAVGLVAVVAIVYAASQPDEVEAQCTDQTGRVVDDRECDRQPTGGYYNSSGAFVPIFLGGFGNQYRYNYGSRSPIGTIAQGGTTTPPSSGTSVRSGTSGSRIGSTDTSGSVSRGGLGVGGSSSSGSSSGSSGSSSSGS